MRFDRRELAAIFAGGFIGAIARAGLAEGSRTTPGSGRGRRSSSTSPAPSCSATSPRACRSACRSRPTGGRCSAPGFCGALTTFSTMQLELLRCSTTAASRLRRLRGRERRRGLPRRARGHEPRPPRAGDRMSARVVLGHRRVGGVGAIARFVLDGAVSPRASAARSRSARSPSTSAARSSSGSSSASRCAATPTTRSGPA